MSTWYILVYLVSGAPKTEVYATQQLACVAYEANKDVNTHVYELGGKSSSPTLTEGECKPIQEFVTHK